MIDHRTDQMKLAEHIATHLARPAYGPNFGAFFPNRLVQTGFKAGYIGMKDYIAPFLRKKIGGEFLYLTVRYLRNRSTRLHSREEICSGEIYTTDGEGNLKDSDVMGGETHTFPAGQSGDFWYARQGCKTAFPHNALDLYNLIYNHLCGGWEQIPGKVKGKWEYVLP